MRHGSGVGPDLACAAPVVARGLAAKTSVQRWRLVRLVLGVSGAILATAGTQADGDPGMALSLVGALCVGLVPLVTSRRLQPAGSRRGRDCVRSARASRASLPLLDVE